MKKFITTCTFLFVLSAIHAQNVGINDDGSVPDSDAILDVDISTNDKGVLIPRLTTAQITAMGAVTTGMLVFNETVGDFQFYNGSGWLTVGSAANSTIYTGSGSLSGNTVVTGGANTLDFTSTATDGFSVDGTTFSVDAANDRVGIGTASPSCDFQVERSTTAGAGTRIDVSNSSTATASYAAMVMQGNNGGVVNQIYADGLGTGPLSAAGGYYGTFTNHPIGIFTNNTERIRIENTGNVGLGITNPANPLHVYSASDNIVKFQGADHALLWIDGTNGSEKSVDFSEGGALQWKIGMDNVNSGGLNDDFIIKTVNNTAAEFTIEHATGDVGIGTGSPDGRLEVAGGRVEFTATTDASGTAGSGVLEIGNSLRLDGNEVITNTGIGLHLNFDNGGDITMDNTTLYVDASEDNVGIGNSSPGSKLTIGTDFATTSGITINSGGNDDSQIIGRGQTGQTAFGLLAYTNAFYLSTGTYWDGADWVHHDATANSYLFGFVPGTGAVWYASSNSSSSWNDASAVDLWNASGDWTSGVNTSTASTFDAGITVGNGTTSAGMISINEDDDDGSNKVTIQAQAMAADYTLTLPVDDGVAGQQLQTDGSGNLTWAVAGGSTGTLIEDTDQDTKVQTEEGADEDIIRFDVGGTEYWTMQGARLNSVNTGNSLFIGDGAGANDDLSSNTNTFLGAQAGNSTTTGARNTAVGYAALQDNTTSSFNTAMGHSALGNTTGSANTAFGRFALQNNVGGSGNTALGSEAGYHATNGNTTGTNNTFIGYQSGLGSSTQRTNATAIGYGATVDADNALILGNGANVGIGTSAPNSSAALDITSTTQGILMPRMTSAQAGAITGVNGLVLYVTDTDATFTSVGFWGYENGGWIKL